VSKNSKKSVIFLLRLYVLLHMLVFYDIPRSFLAFLKSTPRDTINLYIHFHWCPGKICSYSIIFGIGRLGPASFGGLHTVFLRSKTDIPDLPPCCSHFHRTGTCFRCRHVKCTVLLNARSNLSRFSYVYDVISATLFAIQAFTAAVYVSRSITPEIFFLLCQPSKPCFHKELHTWQNIRCPMRNFSGQLTCNRLMYNSTST
jgi:hypothetical protein